MIFMCYYSIQRLSKGTNSSDLGSLADNEKKNKKKKKKKKKVPFFFFRK